MNSCDALSPVAAWLGYDNLANFQEYKIGAIIQEVTYCTELAVIVTLLSSVLITTASI